MTHLLLNIIKIALVIFQSFTRDLDFLVKKTDFQIQFSNIWKVGKFNGRCQKMPFYTGNIAHNHLRP